LANPNLLSNTTSTLAVLIEAQLASGNNDFTVPTGAAWTLRSLTVCNVSGSPVTLNVSVIKSGGTARKVLHNQVVAAGDTLVPGGDMLAMLPEAAVLRLNASAGTALDVLATGLVTA
jgi:hypothetical protein